jgi:hypothetical protein
MSRAIFTSGRSRRSEILRILPQRWKAHRENCNLIWMGMAVTAYSAARREIPVFIQSSSLRRRRAFPMTDTELNVMAALAIIGLSWTPRKG